MSSFIKQIVLSVVVYLFYCSAGYAQPACDISATSNCDPVGAGSVYLMQTPGNVDFTFDSFGKFVTGITQSGATQLKLIVAEAAAPCRWQLHINVDNGGGATPITEWELLSAYGAMGPPQATTNMLEMKVRNQCNTSLTGSSFVTIANTGVNLDVVESPGVDNNAGGCAGINVNRPGSYLTNYGEFSFTVDYRIIPTMNLRPGVYQLTVRYCLTEGI